ncbi:MAG: hypothetical protein OSJ25_04655, partial [Paramuribaculum sp.]|nr:hypothetical protein [Paramuribaculum sp.]
EHARLAVSVSMGCQLGSQAYAHCVIAIPRLSADETYSVFPPLRFGLPDKCIADPKYYFTLIRFYSLGF